VGKSSIANRLLGEERVIVHHEAGTTRDAIDVPFRFDDRDFVLVDTAGLRRRTHVERGVEFYSTLRTRRSLERAHVGILVLDATEPLTAQDARIATLIREAGKSAIFAYNKWDLVQKETGTTESFARALRKKFPHFSDAPVLFVSALTGLRVRRIPPTARDLYEERRRRVSTSELNDLLRAATERRQPPIVRDGRPLRFYYVTQTADSPPTFVVFANYPEDMPASYRTYLQNHFRSRLGFKATPIRMSFRARTRAKA
jgi:GTP-binding protein